MIAGLIIVSETKLESVIHEKEVIITISLLPELKRNNYLNANVEIWK